MGTEQEKRGLKEKRKKPGIMKKSGLLLGEKPGIPGPKPGIPVPSNLTLPYFKTKKKPLHLCTQIPIKCLNNSLNP